MQQQQQLAQQQLQQMQMQRQAIANAHTASAGNVNSYNGPVSSAASNQGMNTGMSAQGMQYTPQQIAAAAASAGLTSGSQGPSMNAPMNTGNMSNGGMSNPGAGVPIRAYLDQTVIPILADGKYMFHFFSDKVPHPCHILPSSINLSRNVRISEGTPFKSCAILSFLFDSKWSPKAFPAIMEELNVTSKISDGATCKTARPIY